MNRRLIATLLLVIYLLSFSTTTVSAQEQPPAAPSNLQVTGQSDTQVLLTWTDNSTDETGFAVYENGQLIAPVAADVTSITVGNLSPNSSHCYVVNAYNNIGNSDWSNEACATLTPPLQLPAAPSNLQATVVSDTQIQLNWIDNSSNETGFHILEGTSIITTVGSDTTSTTVGNLAPNEHCFLVTAYNDAGDSYPTNRACATIVITYSIISGRVVGDEGVPLSDVTITTNTREVTSTSNDGSFTLGDQAPGTYVVTPSKSGWTFVPASRTVTVPPDATDVNFVAAFPVDTETSTPSRTPTHPPVSTITSTATRSSTPALLTATWTPTRTFLPAMTLTRTGTPSRPPTIFATITTSRTPSQTQTKTPTKISTPTDTATATSTKSQGEPRSEVKLVASSLKIEPNPPSAFSRITLRVIVENTGSMFNPPIAFWNYTGKVLVKDSQGKIIETHPFSKGTSSNIVPTKSITSFGIDLNRWEITIHTDIWNAIQKGKIEIVINPLIAHSIPINIADSFTVKPNPTELSKCFAFASSKIASVLPAGKAGSFLQDAKYVADGIAAGGKLATCENIGCAAKALVTLILKYVSETTKMIVAIINIFDTTGGKECAYRAIWLNELVKELDVKGAGINVQSVHSPVYILITNRAGQRTGFLDDGKIVEEIPGSRVAKDGEDKYVVYPADNGTTTRLMGIGEGIMTFSMILNKEGVVEIIYSNITVTAKTIAMIKTSEADNMEIDNNADGVTDTKLRPDLITQISGKTNKNPINWFYFAAVVFIVAVGTAIFLQLYRLKGKVLRK